MSETSDITFNVMDIIRGTTVDGPGFRTSIYLAGCSHHCPGCQNPQSWEPDAGEIMTLEEILRVVEEEDFDVTLSGGDPLMFPEKTKILIEKLKKNRRDVWVYTGYTWEEILHSPLLLDSILQADVVVEGRYLEEMRNLDIPFRGSSNQRIIDIQQSLLQNKIILVRRD